MSEVTANLEFDGGDAAAEAGAEASLAARAESTENLPISPAMPPWRKARESSNCTPMVTVF
jgi:hypothetical protein